MLHQVGHELRDEPFAAEEEVGVVGVEARQALVRAHHRGRRRRVLDPLERRLQVDDAARQLGFERPRLRAPGRGAARERVDAVGGGAAGPVTRRLVDAARRAAAGPQQLRRRDVAARRGVARGDRGDRFLVERLELQQLGWLQTRQRRGLQAGGEGQHWTPAGAEVAQRVPDLDRRAVGVVEDEQRRAARVGGVREQRERGFAGPAPDP